MSALTPLIIFFAFTGGAYVLLAAVLTLHPSEKTKRRQWQQSRALYSEASDSKHIPPA